MADDTTILEFGKAHRGKPLGKVPASYLLWMLNEVKDLDPEIKAYIEDVKPVLERERVREKNGVVRGSSTLRDEEYLKDKQKFLNNERRR